MTSLDLPTPCGKETRETPFLGRANRDVAVVLTQGWLGLEPKEPGSWGEGIVLCDAIPLSSTLGPWGAGRPRGEGKGAEAPGPVKASEGRGGCLGLSGPVPRRLYQGAAGPDYHPVHLQSGFPSRACDPGGDKAALITGL